MKLLNCTECGDILLLRSFARRCDCERSGGRLLRDGGSVQVDGPCLVLTADARDYAAVTLRRQAAFPVSVLSEDSPRLQRSQHRRKEAGTAG